MAQALGGQKVWPIGRGRSREGVQLRSISGLRREGGEVFPRGAEASGALILALEAAACGRRAKTCLEALHSTTLRGGGSKCLVIFRLLAAKETFELLDCEFATKVSH